MPAGLFATTILYLGLRGDVRDGGRLAGRFWAVAQIVERAGSQRKRVRIPSAQLSGGRVDIGILI